MYTPVRIECSTGSFTDCYFAFRDEKMTTEAEEMTTETKGPEKGSNILTDSQTPADWCQKTTFQSRVTLPKILDMDNTEQTETLEVLKNWEDEHDDSSPAELLTFVFQKKEKYKKILLRNYRCTKSKTFLPGLRKTN
ncbi:hypothetical protein ILYODFUR_033547 [Ilyodon furcidens]|uniref:Uncharacterized protein n=1 Tax=Ilyodon furcidens TaxID=33524 RepID=A0ABV0T3U2_9TELE